VAIFSIGKARKTVFVKHGVNQQIGFGKVSGIPPQFGSI
jgi:hypothetical protein